MTPPYEKAWIAFCNYFVIHNLILQIKGDYKKKTFCTICFNSDCKIHNCKTCKYGDAIDALDYWQDVALLDSESVRIKVDDNTDDMERVLPKWANYGEYQQNVNYTNCPSLSIPISVIYTYPDGNIGYDMDGNVQVDITKKLSTLPIKSNLSIYGYWYKQEFWAVRTFQNGFWKPVRQYKGYINNLAYAKADNKLPIDGFWHLPSHKADAYQFVKCGFRV